MIKPIKTVTRLGAMLAIIGIVSSCNNEPAEEAPPAEAMPAEEGAAIDTVAIAEVTAAATKLILEDDPVVAARVITDNCGEPYEGTLHVGFGGPDPVEMPPLIAGFLAVGADRAMVETDAARSSEGYVLFSPFITKDTHLMNRDREIVATHTAGNNNGHALLLDNGNLLRSDNTNEEIFGWTGGVKGCIQETTWDGEIVWQMGLVGPNYIHHHDLVALPNGNVLLNIWDKISRDEAIQAGRNPESIAESGEMWIDAILEIDPDSREIVWEWSMADHLVQDFDPERENYGVVADHPELVDFNKFRPSPQGAVPADWVHVNALDYNAELDQIVLSLHSLSEIWVIDHGTTSAEAASHSGGKQGQGGDILYRWGNPQNYNRGTEEDRTLYAQHNPHWIPAGLPGAGNILVFSNGQHPVRPWTTVLEITPPQNADGSYTLEGDGAFGPGDPAWTYDPEPPERFFSHYISGAQRLPNGNTLVNQGSGGKFREVTPDGEIVWEYWHGEEGDPPHAIFRASWYPPEHPGIMALGLTQEGEE